MDCNYENRYSHHLLSLPIHDCLYDVMMGFGFLHRPFPNDDTELKVQYIFYVVLPEYHAVFP